MRSLMVAGLALVAAGCVDPGGGGGTTTTTSSTTTSSTTSTTIDPSCAAYTPSGVTLSDPQASPGGSITVWGNGADGTTIELLLSPVGPGTATGVLATTPVTAGMWNTVLNIPGDIAVGQWNVVARAQGCTGEATALLDIVP
ncbi:hypothetical protein [Dermatobacter hominis]|uniref:hypothetical protein n=1 Tax=Dermatobacter hominis TaxID=2884263 RepID=UPI001D11C4F3|nr:hypothetical protein [Dermatobacter hominis]UDY36853.1 hypothetical protein LH044_04775 [Dermatobacter hominis]